MAHDHSYVNKVARDPLDLVVTQIDHVSQVNEVERGAVERTGATERNRFRQTHRVNCK